MEMPSNMDSGSNMGFGFESGEDDPTRAELGGNRESLLSMAEIESKLAEGSILQSLDAAYLLYCEYARHVGFSVKKWNQTYFRQTNEVKMKVFVCSCEGKHDNRCSLDRVACYKKQNFRTGCTALLRVKRKRESPWMVIRHQTKHNHEMYEADQSYLLRSARTLTRHKWDILEAMQLAGISIANGCKFMENNAGGVQNLGFIRKDAYDERARIRYSTKVPNADANALINFFEEKTRSEPFFYWNVMLDDDGRLMNFFYRDSRSAMDYECFGDVLSVDTTFRTNKYNLICTPFVGINHHHSNVMFGMGFLSDETTRSFKWLFSTFLESMHRKEPQVIFTDQCQAMMNALQKCFVAAKHRLCQWHVNQNAPGHFGNLNGNREFKQMWYKCMNDCETEGEFDCTWREMVETFGLQERSWFNAMHTLRSRWADVFTNNMFSAGMHATSRSESTNKVLKQVCLRSSNLLEVVKGIAEVDSRWRTAERAEDARCKGMPGQFVEENRLLMNAARVYTRVVFKLLQREAADSMNVDILQHPNSYDDNVLEFVVRSSRSTGRGRRVMYNKITNSVECTCKKFETDGILCRHVLKIFYSVPVEQIPEQYILRRWTKAARYRGPTTIVHEEGTQIEPAICFMNTTMKMTYNMVQDCMDNAALRGVITKGLEKLFKVINDIRLKEANGNTGSTTRQNPTMETSRTIRNPPVAETGWLPPKKTSRGRGQRKRRATSNEDIDQVIGGERVRRNNVPTQRLMSFSTGSWETYHPTTLEYHGNMRGDSPAADDSQSSLRGMPSQSSHARPLI